MNDHDRAQPVYMSGLISALPRLLTISGVLLCVCGMATLEGSLDLYVGIIERDWEGTRPVDVLAGWSAHSLSLRADTPGPLQ